MTDLKSLLNPEQFEAATAPDGPLLILAAAGTGKTRTLVYRVVHLIERGFGADEILLLTFTNRAAREMLERADAATRGLASGLWGGTFHHVANRMLRRFGPSLGFPSDFPILDADDQRSLMARCIKELGHPPREFPKRELILSLLSGAVNRGLSPAEWLERRAGSYDASAESLLRVMDEYRARKAELHAMDFDDLLVNALRLLRENENARRVYQEKFRHVLVDEYQDTNVLQSQFVDLLAAKHHNLSVVGDDFQCIYSWRGSDYRNIMDFPERHPGTRIVKLERNYRSRPEILAVANASIAHNAEQFSKTLRPTRPAGPGRPELVELNDGVALGREVVSLVRRALDDGYAPTDIAVLYRAHYNAVESQLALAKAHVPYRIVSGTGFYEQQHVKDAIALVRLAEIPADGVSFERVVQLLPSVGETVARRVWTALGNRFDAADPDARKALLDALPGRAKRAWEPVGEALGAYRRGVFPANVSALFSSFRSSFYDDKMRRDFENPEERADDLKELAADIASHDCARDFLQDVALLTNLDRGRGGDPAEREKCVLLTTVHQAKGLEWPVVIVPWVCEGIFPSGRALAEQEGDGEERRLFYVAVTRAKDRLHLLQPRWRKTPDGGFFECQPSRFLRELPDGLLDVRPDASARGALDRGWGGGDDGGEPVFRPGGWRPRGGGGSGRNWGWGGGGRGGGRRLHVNFNW